MPPSPSPSPAQNVQNIRIAMRTMRTLLVLFGCMVGLGLGYLTHKSMSLPTAIITPHHRSIHFGSQSTSASAQSTLAPKGTTIHTIFTSDGSPYLNIQSRILYSTFKLVQASPGGAHLQGFTRILHRTAPDVLMQEIPTFLTPPVDPTCDDWCQFPVASRPVSVHAWLNATRADPALLQGDWILLLETDFVWMRPLHPPNALDPNAAGLGFLYTYMFPENYPELMEQFFPGGHVSQIAKTGPAPMLLRPQEWRKIAPLWVAKTQEMERSSLAKKHLGWIREMYAFDIALAMSGVAVHLRGWPDGQLQVHLPSDPDLGAAAMVHYTYGTGFKVDGKEVFRFEKRDFNKPSYVLKVPQMQVVPPFNPAMTMSVFLPGTQVTPRLHRSMTDLMKQINAAIDQLPELHTEQLGA